MDIGIRSWTTLNKFVIFSFSYGIVLLFYHVFFFILIPNEDARVFFSNNSLYFYSQPNRMEKMSSINEIRIT